MQLKINGKEEKIAVANDILSLVLTRGLKPDRVVVEHNFTVIPKEHWNSTVLADGDNIEIVSFVGGG